jgi:hypothetical protein
MGSGYERLACTGRDVSDCRHRLCICRETLGKIPKLSKTVLRLLVDKGLPIPGLRIRIVGVRLSVAARDSSLLYQGQHWLGGRGGSAFHPMSTEYFFQEQNGRGVKLVNQSCLLPRSYTYTPPCFFRDCA